MRDFIVIKERIKNFKWRTLILVVLLPPLLFSWPLSQNKIPFPLRNYIELKKTESNPKISILKNPQVLPLQGESEAIGGTDFFSTLFKIKVDSMPIELCLDNKNKIFEDDKEVDWQGLLDAEEAGAMSLSYHRLDDNLSNEIYVKIGENKCEILPNAGVTLDNLEIRNPLPLRAKASLEKGEVLIKTESRPNLYVRPYEIPGRYYVKWQMSIFVKNFILFFFAWTVFLSSLMTTWKALFNKNQDESLKEVEKKV